MANPEKSKSFLGSKDCFCVSGSKLKVRWSFFLGPVLVLFKPRFCFIGDLSKPIWIWVEEKTLGDHRFWSIFSFYQTGEHFLGLGFFSANPPLGRESRRPGAPIAESQS